MTDANEMDFDGPTGPERVLLDTLLAYLDGAGSLEAALDALRVVVDRPVTEPQQEGDDADPLFGFDPSFMGPEERALGGADARNQ